MNNRDLSPNSPLRAEPRMAGTPPNLAQVPATAGGLIRSTLIAAGAAGALLVLFWLPAEYGIDPTGVGALTGLTEMGDIKQQLAAEAQADAQAVSAPPIVASTDAPDVLARLDNIDAKLAAISAVIGAPIAVQDFAALPAPEPVVAPEPATPVSEPTAPEPVASEPTALDAAADAAAGEWRDEASYTLAPGEGIEVKLAMQEGQVARFFWTANGGIVNFDLHGDGSGEKISYDQGRAVPEAAGNLTAAFTGNHGWFWRNRSEAPVTVTLRVGGEYLELRQP